MFEKIFYAFLCTRIVQFLSKQITGGWCFVSKNDPRFIISKGQLFYEGDPLAIPDRGISNQREEWKKWLIFRLPSFPLVSLVFIDIYNGRRIGYFSISNSDKIMAIRVGYERGIIVFGLGKKALAEFLTIGLIPALQAFQDSEGNSEILGFWEEEKEWTLPVRKEEVKFI
ncbi:MAG: hypothetical protein Q7J14_01480 [Candidatus Magasanikbacteria bacterium]|nr:hypothetical protein [Candidatus Magasanikbacteria bacterium]